MIYAGLTTAAEAPPEPGDTELAISSDPRLSDDDKATLLALYQRLVTE